MNEYIKNDIYRFFEKYTLKKRLFKPLELKYIITFRKAQASKNIFTKCFYRLKLRRLSAKTLIQIPHCTKIGKGFYIGHCGRIIINPKVVIGDNVNIATGVTIGQENRGKRKGVPTIGNEVWIGTNAVIVGNIKIGNNVLISPNAFVNFDVPDNSIVVGASKARIVSDEKATENYICRTV